MGGMHRVRWFNAAFVLLLPHQLGHFLATARSRGCRAGVFWGWWSRGRCGLSLFLSDLPSTAGRGRKGRGRKVVRGWSFKDSSPIDSPLRVTGVHSARDPAFPANVCGHPYSLQIRSQFSALLERT